MFSQTWNDWYVFAVPSRSFPRPLFFSRTLTADSACFTQAMYESTINLIYALTSIAAVSSVNSGKGEYVDALVRARIFWSGILHDWMVNGLRGGRMFL